MWPTGPTVLHHILYHPMPSALRATSPLRPPRIKSEGCHHRRRKRGSSCPWTSPGTRWRLRPKWRSSDGPVQGFQGFQGFRRSAALGIEWDRCAKDIRHQWSEILRIFMDFSRLAFPNFLAQKWQDQALGRAASLANLEMPRGPKSWTDITDNERPDLS